VPRVGRVVGWTVGAAAALATTATLAQSNLDAGKSPAQIFNDTCNACHRSPRELKPSNPAFLREHYTTGAREAATMAAYLASIGSDARAVQQRKPPTLGAGQAAPAETTARPPQSVPAVAPSATGEQAKPPEKPPETQAALPNGTTSRRTPAASEQAKPSEKPAAAAPAVTPTAMAPPAGGKPRRPSESLEAGRLPLMAPASGGSETPSQSAATPAARPPGEEFEE
jgi:hypothetical protein